MRPLLALGLTASLVSSLAACSAQSSDEGVDEGATVVTPHGDDSPGGLNVVLPQGASNVASAKFDPDARNEWLPLGTAFTPLGVGNHPFEVAASSSEFQVTTRDTAAVSSGKTTTVTTAVISPVATGTPLTFGLDQPANNFQISTGSMQASWMRVAAANGNVNLPVVGAQIAFQFGVKDANGVFTDGTKFNIGAGSIAKLDIRDAVQRRRVEVQAPASRDLPDGTCSLSPAPWVLSPTVANREVPISFPTGTSMELGMAPWRSDAETYTLRNPITTLSSTLPMGAKGAAPAVFKIGRIDVAHVQLTNGSPIKGVYQIYEVDAQGHASTAPVLRCELHTGTGVDLPAGKYRVVTTYQTVEAGSKQDVTDVVIP